MSNGKLLWVDDEIDMLNSHLLFLKRKGYDVTPITNGMDAIELCQKQRFDLILLDENMPGLSGLETLARIKEIAPNTPVVMVTKSEEEHIMDLAIGSKIADYLIKPVNPNQILLTLKKNIHQREIVDDVTTGRYQQDYSRLNMQINDSLSPDEWIELYKRLVFWELELSESHSAMDEMQHMQKLEANRAFAKFVKNHYEDWVNNPDRRPMMSPDVMKRRIFPKLAAGSKVFLIVFDNFRYDQWRVLSSELADLFNFEEELYFSILPTSTQYARNALFSGLMPRQIKELYPEYWVDEGNDEGKNLHEGELLGTQIARFRRHYSYSYNKFNYAQSSEHLVAGLKRLENNDLNVLVVNFIDILSHARTEQQMVRELAGNEAAYRSITLSWFRHSGIRNLFVELARMGVEVIITTDHGSIRVKNPVLVKGDRNTSTNLRYKLGKDLGYNPKEVFAITRPERFLLPAINLSSTYIFATEEHFFAYPTNYSHYVNYYKDTFQHGGISMEEMLIPFVTLTAKKR